MITIRTTGNRSLYRSLAESYDTETHHRTATGAARRFARLVRQSAAWQAASGRWGEFGVEINGVPVSDEEVGAMIWAIQDRRAYPDGEARVAVAFARLAREG